MRLSFAGVRRPQTRPRPGAIFIMDPESRYERRRFDGGRWHAQHSTARHQRYEDRGQSQCGIRGLLLADVSAKPVRIRLISYGAHPCLRCCLHRPQTLYYRCPGTFAFALAADVRVPCRRLIAGREDVKRLFRRKRVGKAGGKADIHHMMRQVHRVVSERDPRPSANATCGQRGP